MVKAVAGGGGKGMRMVESAGALLNAVRTARSEAGSAFGDTAVYFERRITHPRHIEIQLLGDHHGTVIPFVERECSIQRRHQKVVEESPSTAVDPALRRRMANAAAAVAKAAGYTNAGTIEFLLDADGSFFFLEMNTRLQVEHPATEMVTNVDLVHWQIRIARGERLTIDPERALTPQGHAIECRIYAEEPDQGFMPSPGLVRAIRAASGPGIRDDGGVMPGYTVPVFYDSMIAKLIAWADTRDEAIARMSRALEEYEVLGIRTTIPFFLWLMRQPDFRAARFDTTYLDSLLASRAGESFSTFDEHDERHIAIAAALDAVLRASRFAAEPARGERNAWTMTARREALRT
jgi:acetyl-CoA carboxylase biotin carboxylase subunit